MAGNLANLQHSCSMLAGRALWHCKPRGAEAGLQQAAATVYRHAWSVDSLKTCSGLVQIYARQPVQPSAQLQHACRPSPMALQAQGCRSWPATSSSNSLQTCLVCRQFKDLFGSSANKWKPPHHQDMVACGAITKNKQQNKKSRAANA